jgi:hypothetical protein
MGLQQFEQRLERLVEGAFSKAFRAGLQPVEIGRRLTREMDLQRRVGVNGLIAPNTFVVDLAPQDADRFASISDALTRELAEAAREHGRLENYEFLGAIEVQIRRNARLRSGRFRITSEMHEAVAPPPRTVTRSLIANDGSRIVLGDQPVVIGRLPECTVVLSDPNVSRRHAEIRQRGNEVVVVDLQSTNGTKVNGLTVTERVLAPGDVVSVGAITLRYEMS